jgi:hypothetical protein
MVIGCIGLNPQGGRGELIEYFSDRNLLDFEILVWNPQQIGGEVNQPAPRDFVERTRKRREGDFQDFFKHGRSLVVLTPPPLPFFETTHGGFPVTFFVPGRPSTAALSGSKYETRFGGGDGPIRDFWERNAGVFRTYTACFPEPVGRPFLLAPGSDQPVLGSLLAVESGWILFLPLPAELPGLVSWANLCDSLEELLRKLIPEDEPMPAWLTSYGTALERSIAENVAVLEAQLAETAELLGTSKSDLETEQRLKLLVSSSGKTLERQVKLALEVLGVEVKPGPESQDDLLLNLEGRFGVAEVKGVSGSAAQKHAAQLEKWCSDRLMAGEESAKGFLIVNAFRDVPLSERSAPVFPDNVVKFSSARNHCLVSTAQLFAVLLEVREHPEKRVEIARELWETVGPFRGYDDLLSRLASSK